jgi:hypothetical protein
MDTKITISSRFLSLAGALLLALQLAACGGEGDEAPTSPQQPPANTAPVANDQSASTNENTALDITLSGSDADGDTLTFTVTASPGNGTLTGTSPDLVYTPSDDYSGSDSFTFTVNDGTEDSAEATVSITVNQFYFTIGGTVTGAVNAGLTLENNGGDSLEVAGVSFAFSTKLESGNDYDVTLTSPPEHQLCSVDNAAGTVTGADVDDVEVLCRYWRTAELIESSDISATFAFAQVAIDGDGNAIAVWHQSDGTYPSIYANIYSTETGAWGTAELIETGDAGNAFSPQIAMDGDGNAIAVWWQHDGTYFSIYANTYSSDSGTWGTAEEIESDNGAAVYPPQIAMDDAGNAIAVWFQNDGTHFSIYANTYSADSGAWGTAELIESSDSGAATDPQIAMNGAGNAIVVWSQDDGTANSIYANIYSVDTGTWGTAELLETDDAGDAEYPQIAMDGAGNGIAVWATIDAPVTPYNLWANTYTAGSGWGAAELIEADNGDALSPQIAFDGAGNGMVVWEQSDGTSTNIWVKTYTADSGWGTPSLLETDDADAYSAQIAFDGAGNAIAVWSQGNGPADSIYANTYSAESGTWDTPELLETGDAGEALSPQIAVNSAGDAIAVWFQHDGTRDNIHANRFE